MFEKSNVTLESIGSAAAGLIAAFTDQKVFAFYGSMGSGKTTLIQAICRELGSTDTITSPTFAIVNEYTSAGSTSIFHFDFYRITTLEEVYDLGHEDYFYSGQYCMIEWPEKVESLLTGQYVKVLIGITSENSRKISAKLVQSEF
jgi:tRNA threonylcarbamoyladenosine biosynthesis protein TsaE